VKIPVAETYLLGYTLLSPLTVAAVAAAPAQDVAAGGPISFTSQEILLITALLGGVIGALTFVFRLFIKSRDGTEKSLYDRVAALERENAESRQAQTALNERMLSLLQGVVQDNAKAITAMAAQLTENTHVSTELIEVMKIHREHSVEEHTKILAAVSSIIAAYDRRLATKPSRGGRRESDSGTSRPDSARERRE
jgi:hypothetical protein